MYNWGLPTGNYYVIVMVYRGLDGVYNSGYTLGRKAGIVDYPQTASPSHADFFMSACASRHKKYPADYMMHPVSDKG